MIRGNEITLKTEFQSIEKNLARNLPEGEEPVALFKIIFTVNDYNRLVVTNKRLCLYWRREVRKDPGIVAAVNLDAIRSYRRAADPNSKSKVPNLIVDTDEKSYVLGVIHRREGDQLLEVLSQVLPGVPFIDEAPQEDSSGSSALNQLIDRYEASSMTGGAPRFSRSLTEDLKSNGPADPKLFFGVMGGFGGMRAVIATEIDVILTGKKSIQEGVMFDTDVTVHSRQNEEIREWQLGSATLSRAFPQAEFHRLFAIANGSPMFGDAFDVLEDGWAKDPGQLPLAHCDGLTLYPDRIIDAQGKHLPFSSPIKVTVDTAAAIAAVRGRNLGSKAASVLVLGPIGPFMVGNAKTTVIDQTKHYLVIESDTWVVSQEAPANGDAELRGFASAVKEACGKHQVHNESRQEDNLSSSSLAEEIAKLGTLHRDGLIDDEEFTRAKAKLLE